MQFEVWNISATPPHKARQDAFDRRKEAYEWMAKYCAHVSDAYEVRETIVPSSF